jgi:hypothetical protein
MTEVKVIRWEDPPPSRSSIPGRARTPGRFTVVAEQLRANPGRWAVISESDGPQRGVAYHIRSGAIECFTPRGDFDAVTRRVNGRSLVYARYLGDGEAGDA